MFRPKSNSNVRKAPTELDNEAPIAPVLEFDYQRCNEPGREPWPERHFGRKFGPSMIRRALQAGLYVMAEIDEAPVPVAVSEARWTGPANNVFEVLVQEGYRIPNRIYTLASLKGIKI